MDMFLSSMVCSAVPIRISMLPSHSLLDTSQCRSQVRQHCTAVFQPAQIQLRNVEVRVGGSHDPPGAPAMFQTQRTCGQSKWI